MVQWQSGLRVFLILFIGFISAAPVAASSPPPAYQTATHQWQAAQGDFAGWTLSGVALSGGALVFSASGENVSILDISGKELPAAAITLLKTLVDRYGAVCQSVEGFLSDHNDLIGSFSGARFRSRSVAAHVVAYAKPDTLTSAFLKKTARWAFHGADLRA